MNRYLAPCVLAAVLLVVGGCGATSSPSDYKACTGCSQSCKAGDVCPKDGLCAQCDRCTMAAYQCPNCGKRELQRTPCAKAPVCHIRCKGCQWENRDACDRDRCGCQLK